ncbi:MAG: esterase-like activity of phytase family protein [Verrucomicrobia bacterium]|nr:esterase-like activity of phytase family protein [Verrucomicrobiota bacterium]
MTAVLFPLCAAEPRGFASFTTADWPRHALKAERAWQLNLPNGERFDASGLLLLPDGGLLTVNDRGAGLYRIQFLDGTNAADLLCLQNCFTAAQLAPYAAEKVDRYDCEGIARDERGWLYLCEEANRWILRFDPKTEKVERLEIDWAPVKKYFHTTDRNASFEGIAIGGGKLYVANERQLGRIIVVNLATLKVEDDFTVRPSTGAARDIHFSDLSWFDDALFALLRESRCVLQIDPQTKKVRAEYSFGNVENAPESIYFNRYPTSTMEGLAVDKDFLWLVTDNNGRGRVRHKDDTRPTLFKCHRPDRK